jgi:hypothetical protein
VGYVNRDVIEKALNKHVGSVNKNAS